MSTIYDRYEIVSGLEIHIELLTKSKLFCGCKASFGAMPNSHTCPVCAGLPGSLPVLNKEAVKMAIKLGLALNCQISKQTHFDRKNYYYPDNPQNYQITQIYSPLCRTGFLELRDGQSIRIKEMHLEDDAGKLIHEESTTFIDYNRSGVPLIELVTEPDFTSSEQVVEFIKELTDILKELDICDCKMQEGSLRVDVNISVRKKGDEVLGVRSEIKNLNSFTEIKHAIVYEKKRHVDTLEEGGNLIQDTRGWDEKQGKSFFMREKENERDYRYFPEPDLPSLIISDAYIEEIKNLLPTLPAERKKLLAQKYKIGEKETEFIYKDKKLLKLFEDTVAINKNPTVTLNWLWGDVLHFLNEKEKSWDQVAISAKSFGELIAFVQDKQITMQTAKELLDRLIDEDYDVPSYVEKHALKVNNDIQQLKEIAVQVVSENQKSVEDYLAGKDRAIKYLIGQGMKALRGRGDVAILTQCILEEIEKGKMHESEG